MKGNVTKVAPSSNIKKVNNPIMMTDIEDSQEPDNLPGGMDQQTDAQENTKGVIIATDGSMLSAR